MNLRRAGLAALATCFALASSAGGAPKPQIEDKSGDAQPSFQVLVAVPPVKLTPAPSQGYADIVSVLWETVKIKGKSNLRVTMTLTAPPGSGGGRVQVYRTYGLPSKCATPPADPTTALVGFAYYSGKITGAPQKAIRENCSTGAIVLHELPTVEVKGNSIIWTVEIAKFPKGLLKKGDTVKNIYAFTGEILDFRGPCVPANAPTAAGACGIVPVSYDDATSTSTFKL